MLEREPVTRHITFLCDNKRCNEFLETETSNWNEAKEIFDDSGWDARHSGDEWFHICPDCQEEEVRHALV